MGHNPKLTPEACRAGRAILRWSAARLSEEAGLSRSIIAKVENGGPISEATDRRIIQAFKRSRVEILSDQGAGARLTRGR